MHEEKEWYAVMVTEKDQLMTEATISDGWFCSYEVTKRLYDERVSQEPTRNWFLVTIVETNKSMVKN